MGSVIGTVLAIVGVVLATALEFWWERVRDRPRAARVDPLKARRQQVDRLTDSLRESADLLAELEQDIAAGHARAEDLQKQIERNSALADLTREQTEAVRRTMGEVIGVRDRRSFWQQAAMNFVFFGLGVIATALVG